MIRQASKSRPHHRFSCCQARLQLPAGCLSCLKEAKVRFCIRGVTKILVLAASNPAFWRSWTSLALSFSSSSSSLPFRKGSLSQSRDNSDLRYAALRHKAVVAASPNMLQTSRVRDKIFSLRLESSHGIGASSEYLLDKLERTRTDPRSPVMSPRTLQQMQSRWHGPPLGFGRFSSS